MYESLVEIGSQRARANAADARAQAAENSFAELEKEAVKMGNELAKMQVDKKILAAEPS